jgi:uncharacterized membrane protein YebE (DUF533 family)
MNIVNYSIFSICILFTLFSSYGMEGEFTLHALQNHLAQKGLLDPDGVHIKNKTNDTASDTVSYNRSAFAGIFLGTGFLAYSVYMYKTDSKKSNVDKNKQDDKKNTARLSTRNKSIVTALLAAIGTGSIIYGFMYV